MTDLTPYEAPVTTSPAAQVDPTGGRLEAWARALHAAHQIGTALCGTAFAPTHFKGKPDDAAAAVMFGDELGFTPTQSVQNIFVISGKPGMYARMMVALVMSKGHEVWTEEASDRKVVVCGQRRGSKHVERSEWTIEKARKAGYTSNKKYEQAPEDMLYARAAGTVCRRIAPDALAGIAYSVEELELEEAPTRTVTRGSAATGEPRRVSRKKAEPVPEPVEPELDDEPATPAPAITDKTRRHLFALFTQKGIGEDRQLDGINRTLGTSYASRSELSEADGQTLIRSLGSMPDAAVDTTTSEIVEEQS